MVWNRLDRFKRHPKGRHQFDYLVVAAPADAEGLVYCLTADGSAAQCWTERGTADVSALGALVMDGDHCGGVPEAMALAIRIMADGPRLSVVILLRGLSEQIFPCDPRVDPILLRKPLSRLSARVTRDYLLAAAATAEDSVEKSSGAPPIPVRPA